MAVKRNYRERVEFQRAVTVSDGSGGVVTDFVTFYQPKGVAVRQLQPSIDQIANSQTISSMIEVEMWYNREAEIRKGDTILWRGFKFVALAPLVNRIEKWVKITCFSQIETTNREV